MDYPVLPKDIQEINRQLENHFGIDTVTGKPMWRVSWSTDQYEKRLTNYTDMGLLLLTPEVRELPKYQYCKDRWILEQLCLVPEANLSELPAQKQSYENMYTFEHGVTGGPIMPVFEACKFVIDVVEAAKGKKSLRKYVDDEAQNPAEAKEKRIQQLTEELFGDESSILGRTITGEAVAYTGEPKVNTSQKE